MGCIWTAATGGAERCFVEPEQVNKILDLGGISTKQLRRSTRTKFGAKNPPEVNVVTSSDSDRVEDQRASGDRVEDQVTSAVSVEDQLNSGDRVEIMSPQVIE